MAFIMVINAGFASLSFPILGLVVAKVQFIIIAMSYDEERDTTERD